MIYNNHIKLAHEQALHDLETIKTDIHRQAFHLDPPSNWMNDPNGLVYFNEEYHVFFQYGPFSTSEGARHWGHYKSKDLLHWELLPPAIAPDETYDKDGCFSGSAVVHNGKLHLLYTGHVNDQRHQWSGQMTIPRVLKEENNYGFDFDNEYVSFSMDASNKVTFTLKNNNNENISVVFDGENQRMKFSRKKTIEIVDSEGKLFDEIIYPVPLDNESWNIEIFVDTSSIQVFVNNYYTLTSTFYAESPLTKVELESKDLQSVCDLKIGRFNKEDGVK